MLRVLLNRLPRSWLTCTTVTSRTEISSLKICCSFQRNPQRLKSVISVSPLYRLQIVTWIPSYVFRSFHLLLILGWISDVHGSWSVWQGAWPWQSCRSLRHWNYYVYSVLSRSFLRNFIHISLNRLCGYPPFEPENGITELEFPSPEWDDISEDAKSLISVFSYFFHSMANIRLSFTKIHPSVPWDIKFWDTLGLVDLRLWKHSDLAHVFSTHRRRFVASRTWKGKLNLGRQCVMYATHSFMNLLLMC